jgi:hypothetical protein
MAVLKDRRSLRISFVQLFSGFEKWIFGFQVGNDTEPLRSNQGIVSMISIYPKKYLSDSAKN